MFHVCMFCREKEVVKLAQNGRFRVNGRTAKPVQDKRGTY